MTDSVKQRDRKRFFPWVMALVAGIVLVALFLLWPSSNRLSLTTSSSGLTNQQGDVSLRLRAIDALQPTEELYSIDVTGVARDEKLSVSWDVPENARKRATYIEICADQKNAAGKDGEELCVRADQPSIAFEKVSCPYYVSANSTGRLANLIGWNRLGDAQKVGCVGDSFSTKSVVSSLLIMQQGIQVSGGGVLVSEGGKIVTKDITSVVRDIITSREQPTIQNITNPVTYLTTNIPVPGPQGAAGLNGADGKDGVDGTDGVDGATGPQGIQGIQGIQGEMGIASVSGGGLVLSGSNLSLTPCAAGQLLKSDGTNYSCATDNDTNTDNQALSLVGNILSIERGNSVDLSAYLDNTNQALSWDAGTRTLSLSNGGGSYVISDADTTYTAGNGLGLTGTTFAVNAPTCTATQKLMWSGTAFTCATDIDTNSGGTVTSITAGTGLNGGTISSTGTISLADTGVTAGTYGSTTSVPVLTVNAQGQITAATSQPITFPPEQDGIVGNEVVGGTGSNSGLVRSGSGTVVDPYTLAVSVGSGLQVTGNQVAIIAPTCTATQKLSWNGTAFVCSTDIDTNTDNQQLTVDTSAPNASNTTTTTVGITGGNSVQFVDRDTVYSAGTGISFSGNTINNTGVLSVTSSGAVTSTGGQNPTIGVTTSSSLTQTGGVLNLSNTGVVAGTYNTVTVDAQGRITSGSNVAYLTGEQDGVIGNEITDVVAGSGLVRTGAGTVASPYQVGLITTCTTGQLLKWNGTAWACSTDIDTNTDQQNLSLAGTTLSISSGNSVNLAPFLDNTDNQALSWTPGTRTLTLTNGGSVVIADANTTYTADNGLTMTGTNNQLGGTLLKNTTVAQAGYDMNFTGGRFVSQRQGADTNYYTMTNGDNALGAGINGITFSATAGATYAGGKATYTNLADGSIRNVAFDGVSDVSTMVMTPNALSMNSGDGSNRAEIVLNDFGQASLSSYAGPTFSSAGVHTQFVFNSNGTASIRAGNGSGALTEVNYTGTAIDTKTVNFTVRDTVGVGVPKFTVNTTANTVQVGEASNDLVAVRLVLDHYNSASDPAGINGAMYYNSNLGKFRCYENGTWKNCIGTSALNGKTAAVNVPAATALNAPGTVTQTVTFAARPTATYNVICTPSLAVMCSVSGRTTTGFTITLTNPVNAARTAVVTDWFITE